MITEQAIIKICFRILIVASASICFAAYGETEELYPPCGTLTIEDRETFEFFSDRNNFPGAMQVLEVKFLIANVNTPNPQLYFQNTKNYPFHYDFAVECLGWSIDLTTFNNMTYFSDHRSNLAGSIIAHDHYEPNEITHGIYTMEFWPTDPVTFEFVQKAFDMITENMPFVQNKLFYHAAGETQRALYETERDLYDLSSVAVIQTEELFGNISYAALTTGEAYGKLKIVQEPETVTVRDIVIYRTIPNTLPHVAGIITEVPQTPLSHINLKAKQNNTPNVYIKDATNRADILELDGQYVHFIVQPEGYILEEATFEDVNEFFESIRPTEPQFPPRNLDVTIITPLSEIGFDDSNSYGAKAANVAELAKFLPFGMVPDGFAVPFYFYDKFMIHNGFYDMAADMMSDPIFQNDPEIRDIKLEEFRRTIRNYGVMQNWMLEELQVVPESFEIGTSLRCRSSTNNEDLPNFNGAGLYDSYTHYLHEGHIAKSIKQVWASLWTYRAFEEREFYRIDHMQTAMGVLVHPNYKNELANGVGVTKNIYDPNWSGFYVNVQVGEDMVTNPQEFSIPDEFLVADLMGEERYEIQYIRHSNLIPDGEYILTKEQIFELADMMQLIHTHFQHLYNIPRGDKDFAMEIEFKITSDGYLNIKQARPWID